MAQSEPLGQSSPHNVDVGSFVVYRSPQRDCYHTKPGCASDADIPPALDAANDLLEGLEMYRVEEIEEELNDDNLCSNCATRLRRVLGFEV